MFSQMQIPNQSDEGNDNDHYVNEEHDDVCEAQWCINDDNKFWQHLTQNKIQEYQQRISGKDNYRKS